MNTEENLSNIDSIKTVSMLLVVFYHSCMFFTGTWFTAATPVYDINNISVLTSWLNTFHVQTFTAMSGYLFYYLRYNKYKYRSPLKDIKKRALRLFLPFLSTAVVWGIPFRIIFSEQPNIFNNYILGKSPNQYWFLLMLFWIFIISYYLFDVIKPNIFGVVLMVMLSSYFGYLLKGSVFEMYQIRKAIQYICYYYFGAYLCKQKYVPKTWHCICFAAASISSYFYFKQDWYIFSDAIVSVFGILMMYSTITCASVFLQNKKIESIFNNLSSASFGIYLFHQQIIYLTIPLLNGLVSPYMQILISFCISISVSYIIVKFLQKWKITRLLFGL